MTRAEKNASVGGSLPLLVAMSATVLPATMAHAQTFSRLEVGQQAVSVESGLESAVTVSLGYAAALPARAIGRTVIAFIRGTLLVARPDLHDYGLRAGTQLSVLDVGWIDLSTQVAFGLEGTANNIYSATTLRSDFALVAGHYAQAWFVAGELGYDHSWLTHIRNSDWYRRNIYPDAKDGWYHNSAGNLRAGLKAGLSLGSVELVLRGGLNRTGRLAALALPFYATVGGNYRF